MSDLRRACRVVAVDLLIAAFVATIQLIAYAIYPPTMRWWYPAVVAFAASFITPAFRRSAQRSAEGTHINEGTRS